MIISFIGVGLGADQRRGALGPGAASAGSMIAVLQHGTVTSPRKLKYSLVVYLAVIALLEVLELDRAWFELCDRGLQDFTAWAAGQTVDEEEMKNFDVRMLAASTVPAPLAGMMPLDTPETIGAAQNFILIGTLT